MPERIISRDAVNSRVSARKDVIRDKDILPLARVLYVYLDDLCWETGVTETARWTIASEIGATVRHVGRLLDLLNARGYICTVRGSDRERHTMKWAVDGRTGPIRRGRGRPLDRTYRSYLGADLNLKVLQDKNAPPLECKCKGSGTVSGEWKGVVYLQPCPACTEQRRSA